jgi:hypothetical protein
MAIVNGSIVILTIRVTTILRVKLMRYDNRDWFNSGFDIVGHR